MLTKKESRGMKNIPKLGRYLGRSESRESKAKKNVGSSRFVPWRDLRNNKNQYGEVYMSRRKCAVRRSSSTVSLGLLEESTEEACPVGRTQCLRQCYRDGNHPL